VGTPLELYDHPANQFVAQFIGTPQMNVVALKQLPPAVQAMAPAGATGGSMGLRPENVLLSPNAQGAIHARVDLVEALGAETLVYVSTAEGAQLVARLSERTALVAGDPVTLDVATEHAHWFDRSGRVVLHADAAALA
jgi:multiple sugar transport system ATP-binding protein